VAANGNVFIELDHRGNPTAVDGIYQDVPTISGRSYELRFFMRSRSAISSTNNEAVIVEWRGQPVGGRFVATRGNTAWTEVVVLLQGSGGLDRLVLREDLAATSGNNNGQGPLIDFVQLFLVD
jgi:hypothetical protein